VRWLRSLAVWRHRRELDDEIAAHLAMATRDGIERGLPPDEARAAAERGLGNVARVKQETREVWSWTAVEHALQDLRFGTRILWQAPGLSASAVLLVALVIGANTTIYSIVSGMLVSPARGVTAERLVAIKHAEQGASLADPFISYPNYRDYTQASTTVPRLAGWIDERLTIGTTDGNFAVFGALVTANYFDTLGVAVSRGRALGATDDDGRDGVAAVISDDLWIERFDRAADVVGRTIAVNRVTATIVGVAAPGFAGALLNPDEDVWVPIRAYYHAIGSADVLENRSQPLVVMVGQRTTAASLSEVRAEFDALARQLRAAYPGSFTTLGPRGVVPLERPRVSVSVYSGAALLPMADMAPTFLAVFSVVTLLTLVVVSANVANLMLGRAVERQRDTAVRRSLGASRVRVVRMLVAEGAAVSLVAWAAACLVAWWTARVLLQVVEPRPGMLAHIRPGWTLAAYAMVLAGAATMVFTLAPAIRSWRLPVLPLLKNGESSVARGRSRLSGGLVVLQLALSVVLLTSAGLAYRSLSMLDTGRVGFDPGPMLLTTVRAGRQDAFVTSQPRPDDRRAELALLERVRERLAGEAQVVAVSYSRRVPGAYLLSTAPVRLADGDLSIPAYVRPVGPGYLGTLGLSPMAGRDLAAIEAPGATRAAVVNQHAAQALFGDRSPLGRSLRIDDGALLEVVGVAPNALFDGPVHEPQPRYVFVAQQQITSGALIDMTFFIRHSGTLDALTPRVGRAIAEVAPTLPLVSMSTMTARLSQVTVLQEQITTLVMIFAVAALIVAALGQYAVAMFDMRRRTRELGVRIALGASPGRLERAAIREACGLTLPGVLAGFALSVAVAVTFRAVLFGVTPLDPSAYGGVFVLVGLTSIVASYLPARRAGRVNVVDALRHE
jgi:predicted permease